MYSREYMLLGRLKRDCELFLENGRDERKLWALSVPAQIAKMRELFEVVPLAPIWLTKCDIDEFERKMCPLRVETMSINDIEYLSFENNVMILCFKDLPGFIRYDDSIRHFNNGDTVRISKNSTVGKHIKAIRYFFIKEATVSDLCIVYENSKRVK
ncbi:MAG: LPD11 domain-containing protein [Culicoidibacterales bacterium]